MKRKLLLVLFLLLLLLGGVVALVLTNTSRIVQLFQPQIEKAISRVIGSPVELGEIEASILPVLKLEANSVQVQGDSLQVGSLVLYPEFWPLLSKELRISRVFIGKPTVSLTRDASGIYLTSAKPTPSTDQANGTTQNSKDVDFSFRLETLEVEEAKVTLNDKLLHHKLSLIADSVQTGFSYQDNALDVQYLKFDGSLSNLSSLAIDAERIEYDLRSTEVTSKSIKLTFPFGEFTASGSGNVGAKSLSLRMRSEDLKIDSALQLLALASIDLRPYKLGGSLAPDLSISYKPDALTIEGKVALSELTGKWSDLEFGKGEGVLQLALSDNAKSVRIEKLTAKLPQTNETLSLSGNVGIDPFSLKLKVSSPSLQVSPTLASLPQLQRFVNEYSLSGTLTPSLTLEHTPKAGMKTSGEVTLSKAGATYQKQPITDLNGKVLVHSLGKGYSLSTPKLSGKATSDGLPFTLSGDLTTAPLKGKLQLQMKRLDMQKLRSALPALAEWKLRGLLDSDLALSFDNKGVGSASGTLGFSGLNASSSKLQFTEGRGTVGLDTQKKNFYSLTSKDLTFKLNGHPFSPKLRLEVSPDLIRMDRVRLQAFGGEVSGYLDLVDRRRRPTIKTGGEIRDVRIEKLLPVLLPSSKLVMEGDLKRLGLKLSGSSQDFAGSQQGRGTLEIGDAILRKVNLGRLVFEKVGEIPIIGRALLAKIPAEFNQYFQGTDTPIQKMTSNILFRGGDVELRDLRMVSDVYGIQGDGVIRKDGSLSFRASMLCDQDLSLALLRKVKELQPLVDRKGFMRIPFAVSGSYPNIRVLPDIEDILKRGASRLIQKELGNLLDDFLRKQGGDDDRSQ